MRLGGLLSFLLVVTPSLHAGGTIELAEDPPLACPTRATIERQVEDFLGRPLGSGDEAELAVEIRLQTDGGAGFRSLLTIRSAAGERRRVLEHDDCAKLGEATALLIALAIDPEAVHADAERTPAPDETEASRVVPRPSPTTPPAATVGLPPPPRSTAPAGSRRARRELSAEARGLVGTGVLPGVGFGAGGGIGLGVWRSWRLLSLFSVWPRRIQRVGAANVELGLVSAGVRGCWSRGRRWESAFCAGPEIGSLAGRGLDLTVNRTASDRWSALVLEAALGYAVTPGLLLRGALEVCPALERPRFEVDGRGEVHRPAAVGYRSHLGLSLRFGAGARAGRPTPTEPANRSVKTAP